MPVPQFVINDINDSHEELEMESSVKLSKGPVKPKGGKSAEKPCIVPPYKMHKNSPEEDCFLCEEKFVGGCNHPLFEGRICKNCKVRLNQFLV